jgi:hypothetical protein
MPAKRDARAPLAPSRSTREWWFISTRVLYNYLRRGGREDDDAADDAAALQEGIIRESWSASPRSAFKRAEQLEREGKKKTVWKLFNLEENFAEAKERGEFEKTKKKKKKKKKGAHKFLFYNSIGELAFSPPFQWYDDWPDTQVRRERRIDKNTRARWSIIVL